MCLFDVVDALDLKKNEKNGYFCIFLKSPAISRYFPLFSPLLPLRYIPDPRRYFRRNAICNFGWDYG